MKSMSLLIAVLLAIASGSPAGAQDGSARREAETFLTTIYKGYASPGAGGTDFNATNVRRLFSPPLAKLILADQRNAEASGEVGRLDGDPFLDAQDWDIKDLKIMVEPGAGNRATGSVTFYNLGEAKQIRFDLLKGIKGWQVDDIHWDRGDSLRHTLTAAP